QSRLPAKKIVATRYPQLIPFGFGSGAMQRPCKSRPLGASLRLAPAYRKRFGDFQPDSRSLNLLCGMKVARMLSPAEIGEPETG
ncbi:MAG: hypothetical protein LBE93_09085, partial [Enterobacter asburiae]|nr:hypothetical protein [Enterobacter asburiae]